MNSRNAVCEVSPNSQVIDYTQEHLVEHFKELKEEEKFDVVYDAASGSGGGEDYKF